MPNTKHKFPKELFVNVGDVDDGKPIFCASDTLDEIPEDQHGELIAVYGLMHVRVMEVRKTLA